MVDNSWHLSKSVPITLILAILMQTVSLVWFVSTLRNDLDKAQTDIIRHDTKIEGLGEVVQGQAITMARMDENIKSIRELLEQYLRSIRD
jgi:hypothetical protein